MTHQNFIKPPALSKGDEIRLVTTARKITPEELQPALEIIREWGLKPTTGHNLFAEDRQFGGTDKQRAEDLQNALNDNNVKAILCVRGGYGTVRIIDQLDFSAFQKHPKWVAGYSDVTALHNHLHRHIGACSLHSTMPINFSTNTPQALQSLRDALTGNSIEYDIPAHPKNKNGQVEGILTGGNLSMLYSLMGSSTQVDTTGKILFIEDLDEYLYHVDRMMINLKRSGMIENLKGLILGGLTDMRDNTVPFGRTAEEIVEEAIADYNYPVCFGFPAGHLADNRTLILGAKTKLTVGDSGVSFAQ